MLSSGHPETVWGLCWHKSTYFYPLFQLIIGHYNKDTWHDQQRICFRFSSFHLFAEATLDSTPREKDFKTRLSLFRSSLEPSSRL